VVSALPLAVDTTKNLHQLYRNSTPIQHFLNVLPT